MRTRFAPSPTGPLHLGHAFSALSAFEAARAVEGTFLLRIEDIDAERSKPAWEAQIFEDLRWLGLDWPTPVRRQSDHLPLFADTIAALAARGLVYPCSCNRADIRAAASAPQEGAAPAFGPDGLIYPGTCRGRHWSDRRPGDAVRLNIAAALQTVTAPLRFTEIGDPHRGDHEVPALNLTNGVGDVVLERRGTGFPAYHLAVVVDDAAQDITYVVRGADLFEATPIHVLLQRVLGLPTPIYHHHRLIRDDAGRRLAKRTDAQAIATYRDQGAMPEDVRAMVGL